MRVITRATSASRSPLIKTASRATVSKLSQTSIAHERAPIAAPRALHPSIRTATMSTESTQSQACCNTPAVTSGTYKEKGDWIEADGLKTCMLVAQFHFTCINAKAASRCYWLQGR